MHVRGDALALVTQVVKQSGVAWVTGWVFINMWGDTVASITQVVKLAADAWDERD